MVNKGCGPRKLGGPLKNVKELKEVVKQLEGAVIAHGKQAKTIQEHVSMMKSPAKVASPFKLKDACYHKVKAQYDVFPSAYASGAIAKCRKNKGKKKK